MGAQMSKYHTMELMRKLTQLGLTTIALALLGLATLPTLSAQRYWREDQQSLFSLPRSQDDIHKCRMAQADVQAGRYLEAVERLHSLLSKGQPGVIPLTDETGSNSRERFLGLRLQVLKVLASLPPAGQEAVDKLTDREAGGLQRSAFLDYRPADLNALAWQFPTSTVGRRARLRLADMALASGRIHQAQQHLQALLLSLPAETDSHSWVAERLVLAQPFLARNLLAQGWPAYGGGGDGSRSMQPPPEQPGNEVQLAINCPGYRNGNHVVHATGGMSGIFVNTGVAVIAIDPITGRQQWQGDGPLSGPANNRDYDRTLSEHIALSASVSDDLVVAALQVPNDSRAESYHHLDLIFKIPTRRLFAFNRHSGKLVWAHWNDARSEQEQQFKGHDACGTPLIVGDTVYIPTQDFTGAIAYYVAAYDLHTGEPRWRSLCCSSQGEVNMFGNAQVEFTAAPLAMRDGVLYGTTNLGICFALEASSGLTLWATAYPVIPLPPTRLTNQQGRMVPFANNPVLVANGVMVCTPLDSEYALALDCQSGKIIWRMHYRAEVDGDNQVRWMLGLLGDEVIFSGRGVVAAKLQTRHANMAAEIRQLRDPSYLGYHNQAQAPRGAITAQNIYLPTDSGIQIMDAKGTTSGNSIPMPNQGNLLLSDGLLVISQCQTISIRCDLEELVQAAELAIRQQPQQPENYLQLATLLYRTIRSHSEASKTNRASQLLLQGLNIAKSNGLDHNSPIFRKLSTELFVISMARAQAAKREGLGQMALNILVEARDRTEITEQWLKAQEQILLLHANSSKQYLAELELMMARHGQQNYDFARVGDIPVRAYALWQSISRLDSSQQAASRCQELLENYPSVSFGNSTAKEFATAELSNLLELHGRHIYVAIEARAKAALQEAGQDRQLLLRIEDQFPHSQTAIQARNNLLDLAIAQKDLRTACEMFQRQTERQAPSAGLYRRLMLTAQVAENPALAKALGQRLLTEFGQTISNYPADGKARMQDLIAEEQPIEIEPAMAQQLPQRELGKPLLISENNRVQVLTTRYQSGEARPSRQPVYATISKNRRLIAIDLSSPDTWGTTLFSLEALLLSTQAPLLICGEQLIFEEVNNSTGQTRICAVHYRSGDLIWKHAANGRQKLKVLGAENGVILVYAQPVKVGGSEQIIGLESTTGTMLYRYNLQSSPSAGQPLAALGDLWVLHWKDEAEAESALRIQRIDGLTGQLRQTIPLPASLQDSMQLHSPPRNGNTLHHLQENLLINKDRIILSLRSPATNSKPVIAALDHQGKQIWLWSNTANSSLPMVALHQESLVIVSHGDRGAGSARLTILNLANGTEKKKSADLNREHILNWNENQMGTPAPDRLLITQGAQSLTCYSLNGQTPSFKYDLNEPSGAVISQPVFGPDFLAIPIHKRTHKQIVLHVIRLSDQRGALENGKTRRILPIGPDHFQMMAHPPYTICRTTEGIVVLGTDIVESK